MNCKFVPNILRDFTPSDNIEELSKQFEEIAKALFSECEIIAGLKHYEFVEVEFYLYNHSFHSSIFACTYPRTKNAGDFFWHYSGVDICFKSDEGLESGNEPSFGGILIRTLKNKETNELICGPLRCANELMNSCDKEMPRLEERKTKKDISELQQTIRQGIQADIEEYKKGKETLFCFYLPQNSWSRTHDRLCLQNGKFSMKRYTESYKDNPQDRIGNLVKKGKL